MADQPRLEIERRSSSTSRKACYIGEDFSCAVISLNNKDNEEFSYKWPAHRLYFNLSGTARKADLHPL